MWLCVRVCLISNYFWVFLRLSFQFIICLLLDLQMGLFSFLSYIFLIINTLSVCRPVSFAMNTHERKGRSKNWNKLEKKSKKKCDFVFVWFKWTLTLRCIRNCIRNVAIKATLPVHPFTRSFISIIYSILFFHIC